MSNGQSTTKVLKGKYQLSKNIFVSCYLNVLEATDQEIRAFVGLKRNANTQVPIGTKIIFDAGAVKKNAPVPEASFDILSITVRQIEEKNGQPLLVCTPIQKETRQDQRQHERRDVDFPMQIANSSAVFIAKNGSSKGLTLQYTANRAMVSLSLNRVYNFSVQLKGETYPLPGQIKRIQYDWTSYQHIIGVDFSALNKDQDIILNLMVDPEYTVQLSNKQTVDTASGKISVDD